MFSGFEFVIISKQNGKVTSVSNIKKKKNPGFQ